MILQGTEKFEYMIPKISGYSTSKMVDELNKLGAQGWELVGNLTDTYGRSQYLMKRKIIEVNNQ